MTQRSYNYYNGNCEPIHSSPWICLLKLSQGQEINRRLVHRLRLCVSVDTHSHRPFYSSPTKSLCVLLRNLGSKTTGPPSETSRTRINSHTKLSTHPKNCSSPSYTHTYARVCVTFPDVTHSLSVTEYPSSLLDLCILRHLAVQVIPLISYTHLSLIPHLHDSDLSNQLRFYTFFVNRHKNSSSYCTGVYIKSF